jgi:phosphate:Na+ symporter
MAGAKPDPELDLQDLYERRIKGLYSAIMEYAARAERDMVPAQVELLYHLKVAVRDVVLALKNMQHLHRNLVRYSASDNPDIRAEYARISLAIGQILRLIDRIHVDPKQTLETLLKHRKAIKAYEIVDRSEFQTLVRDHRITADMATSLINDTNYAKAVLTKLIKAARSVLEDKSYDVYRALAESPPAEEEEEPRSAA